MYSSSRGSVLVSTLVLGTAFFIVILVVGFLQNTSIQLENKRQLRTMARINGINAVFNGMISLKSNKRAEYLDNGGRGSFVIGGEGGKTVITGTGYFGDEKYQIKLSLRFLDPTRFLYSVNSPVLLTPSRTGSLLQGGVLAAGNIRIGIPPVDEFRIIKSDQSGTPLLASAKGVSFFSMGFNKGKTILSFHKKDLFGKEYSDFIYTVFNTNKKPMEEAGGSKKGLVAENLKMLHLFSPIKTLSSKWEQQIDLTIDDVKNGPFPREIIVNDALFYKQLLTKGDGITTKFHLIRDVIPRINNIYLQKVDQEISGKTLLPERTSLSRGGARQFKVIDGGKTLILPDEKQAIEVKVSPGILIKRNIYALAGNDYSYLSESCRLSEVYINNRRVSPGFDYNYDAKKKQLHLLHPRNMVYLRKGDGFTKRFSFSGKKPVIVFLGDAAAKGYSVSGNAIVFRKAPVYDTKIYYLTTFPKITIYKKAPAVNVGIFMDKNVDCVKIELDKLAYASSFVLRLRCPALISGRSRIPITIIAEDDVYLDSIVAHENVPVSIYARRIWIRKQCKKLEQVFLYTEADRLYYLSDASQSYSLKGSLVFCCFQRSYKKGAALKADSFQARGIQFSPMFSYAPGFNLMGGSPTLFPAGIHIFGWKEQP